MYGMYLWYIKNRALELLIFVIVLTHVIIFIARFCLN